MSKIKYTPQGFSYVDVNLTDCINWGGLGICAGCDKISNEAKLIFVLGDIYCNECFNDWLVRCRKYKKEDIEYDLNLQKENDIKWYQYHGILDKN